MPANTNCIFMLIQNINFESRGFLWMAASILHSNLFVACRLSHKKLVMLLTSVTAMPGLNFCSLPFHIHSKLWLQTFSPLPQIIYSNGIASSSANPLHRTENYFTSPKIIQGSALKSILRPAWSWHFILSEKLSIPFEINSSH